MSRKLPGISYYSLWGHLTIEPIIVYVENNYHISDTGHFCVEKNCARNCVCGKKLPHLSERTLLQKMYVEKNWAKKCVCGEKWPHLSHGTLPLPSIWPQLNINMSRDRLLNLPFWVVLTANKIFSPKKVELCGGREDIYLDRWSSNVADIIHMNTFCHTMPYITKHFAIPYHHTIPFLLQYHIIPFAIQTLLISWNITFRFSLGSPSFLVLPKKWATLEFYISTLYTTWQKCSRFLLGWFQPS